MDPLFYTILLSVTVVGTDMCRNYFFFSVLLTVYERDQFFITSFPFLPILKHAIVASCWVNPGPPYAVLRRYLRI